MNKRKWYEILELVLLAPSFLAILLLIVVYAINSIVRIPFLWYGTDSFRKAIRLWIGHTISVIKDILGNV